MPRVSTCVGVLLASLLWSTAGLAVPGCPEIEQFLDGQGTWALCAFTATT